MLQFFLGVNGGTMNYTLDLGSGTFALTGGGLTLGVGMTLGSGTFTLTGSSLGLVAMRKAAWLRSLSWRYRRPRKARVR